MKTEVKNNILTITIDLTENLGRSKSGKSNIVATTSGAIEVKDSDGKAVKVNLNVYRL